MSDSPLTEHQRRMLRHAAESDDFDALCTVVEAIGSDAWEAGRKAGLGVVERSAPATINTEDTIANQVADAIQAAIEEVLSANGGGMIAGFTTCLQYYDSDGDKGWAIAHAEGQPLSDTIGLLRWHTILAETDLIDTVRKGRQQ